MNMFIEIKNDLRSVIYPMLKLDYRLAILEVIDALWAEDRKPQIQTSKNGTFVINLPAGISFKDFYAKKDYFKDAIGGSEVIVNISQKGKQAILQIHQNCLKKYYEYQSEYNKNGILPIPLGYSNQGLEVIDLTILPHMLIGGSTGGGKSNFIHGTIESLKNLPQQPQVMLIDLKMSEYAYLENEVLLITELKQADEALTRLVQEMRKRQMLLKKSRCVDIKRYNKNHRDKLSYIVLIIDELAELKLRAAQDNLETLLRLCRASGIIIIAATQRPSSCMFAKKSFGDSKANFSGRLCFQVNSEIDKKIILDEYGTEKIENISGRAIWRHGIEIKTIQTMYFNPEGRGIDDVQQYESQGIAQNRIDNKFTKFLALLKR